MPAILAIEWAAIGTNVLILVFVAVSLLMVLTVLIQRPAGGGLSGAFGSGAGSGQTAFGTKTGDALTIATITMFSLFLIFAVVLVFVARPDPQAAAVPTAGPANQTAPADPGTEGAAAPAQEAASQPPPADGGTTPAAPAQPAPQPAAPPSDPPSTPPPAP